MRRDSKTGAPNFYSFARDYLHTYLPTVQRRSPKTIEAYQISLECFLDYLAEADHVERPQVSFDHFDRGNLKGWMAWMADQRQYAPPTVALGQPAKLYARLGGRRATMTTCASSWWAVKTSPRFSLA